MWKLLLTLWCSCRTEDGGPKKTIKQTKSRFDQKDLGQAEKQLQIRKYNAKLIKYSPSTTKSSLWGAEGAPEGEFGRSGAVFNQFSIVFAHVWLFFGLARVFLIKSRFGLFDCILGSPILVWQD